MTDVRPPTARSILGRPTPHEARPPRPCLTLRIAVSGHRPGKRLPNTEVERIAHQVAQALRCAAAAAEAVRRDPAQAWAYDDRQEPCLRMVSALAEGADRIAAEAALADPARRWTLEAALPMLREDYLRDFNTEESRAAFDRLHGAATTVFELPTPEDADRDDAYRAVGRLLLDHCDLLLAIWDGGPSAGPGGTRAVLDEALRRGIPVVWVHSLDPAAPALWDGRTRTPLGDLAAPEPCGADGALGRVVAALLGPPADPALDVPADAVGPGPCARLREYCGESMPDERRGVPWWRFHDRVADLAAAFAGRHHDRGPGGVTPPTPAEADCALLSALPGRSALRKALGETLFPRRDAADARSTHLGRVYRSDYAAVFLLAAGAVVTGLVPVFFWESVGAKALCVALELGLVSLVVWLIIRGRPHHRRWLDARHLAELLRYGGMMALLGSPGGRAAAGGNRGDAASGSGDAWVAWYARATFRELGLPAARADEGYLRAVADAAVRGLIGGQIAYHETTHRQLLRVHHGLERTGAALFWATAAVLLVFLGLAGADWLSDPAGHGPLHDLVKGAKPWVTFLGAGLPALGAALAGIRAQGDYETRAHRSRATAAALRSVQRRLPGAVARGGDAAHREVRRLLAEAAEAMLDDLGAWRLVYSHRPIAIPG